jgi:hypothetical protein
MSVGRYKTLLGRRPALAQLAPQMMMMMCLLFVLAETKKRRQDPYTFRKVLSSSFPTKTPFRSYSDKIRSQNEEKNHPCEEPPLQNHTCPYRQELDIDDHTDPIQCAK